MKARAHNVWSQTRMRVILSLKALVMSKVLCHESSFYSPKHLSWNNSGCAWLARVLAKCTDPTCHLNTVPPTRRTGLGQSDYFRKPSVPEHKMIAVVKKPAMRRPASNSGAQRFKSLWKRPATKIDLALEGVCTPVRWAPASRISVQQTFHVCTHWTTSCVERKRSRRDQL